MNALFAPRSTRMSLLFVLAVSCLLAADGPVVASASLQANFIFELVSDRARLIQVSLIFVTIGIWLLWWNR